MANCRPQIRTFDSLESCEKWDIKSKYIHKETREKAAELDRKWKLK